MRVSKSDIFKLAATSPEGEATRFIFLTYEKQLMESQRGTGIPECSRLDARLSGIFFRHMQPSFNGHDCHKKYGRNMVRFLGLVVSIQNS